MKPLTDTKRLYDLLHAVPADQVMAACQRLYPADAKGMRAAYLRMLRLEPKATCDRILRARVIVSKGETFHVVTCVEPSSPTGSALGLPWPEWLAARVPASAERKYPPAVLLAHCLRGMTMLGFSAAHIKRTFKRIDETLSQWSEEARAGGFTPEGEGMASLDEDAETPTKAQPPQMVLAPSFQKSLSKLPARDRKLIKRSIARVKWPSLKRTA
jgi:hypothetical protein